MNDVPPIAKPKTTTTNETLNFAVLNSLTKRNEAFGGKRTS
jgi:hypothetical protein